MLHQFRRDLEGLDQAAQTAIMHAGAHGFPYYAAWAELLRGWSRAARSAGEQGIDEILRGIEVVQRTAGLRLPYYRVLLAEAYGWNGRIEEALQALDVAWSEIRKTQERWWEPELHRLRGELLRSEAANRMAEAEACFRRAAEVARTQQAKSLELRAAMSLARLLRDQGRPTDARPLLAEVYDWFTEGFDTPDLRDARRLLEELTL
jgi:predicted ATPase